MRIRYLDDRVKFCVIEGRKVKLPERAHETDAGIDIFAPLDIDPISLKPHDDVIIGTGLRIHVPSGYAFIITEKSGVSTKQKINHGAKLIDEGYSGEIKIHVINFGNTNTMIEPGQKLTQGILMPVETWPVDIIPEKEYLEKYSKTARGENGFGSTGK